MSKLCFPHYSGKLCAPSEKPARGAEEVSPVSTQDIWRKCRPEGAVIASRSDGVHASPSRKPRRQRMAYARHSTRRSLATEQVHTYSQVVMLCLPHHLHHLSPLDHTVYHRNNDRQSQWINPIARVQVCPRASTSLRHLQNLALQRTTQYP